MKNIKGYTLVEIAIVMLIISIMAIVVKGTYDGTVEKSKWSEAYTVIGKIIDAQKEFHVLNDRFAKDFKELNLNIGGDKEKNGIGIVTQYFKYKTASDDSDKNICKISVARVFKKKNTEASAEVSFNLQYLNKDNSDTGQKGNTFYIPKEKINITIPANFTSQPAIREANKLAEFFTTKS